MTLHYITLRVGHATVQLPREIAEQLKVQLDAQLAPVVEVPEPEKVPTLGLEDKQE